MRTSLLPFVSFVLSAVAADECAQPSPEEMARIAGVTLPAYPWHTANIWWEFTQPIEHFESLEMDITIDRDVPSTYNLYVSPVGSALINGLQFYGGLQTNINGWESPEKQERVHRGQGAIFSRWSHDKKTSLSAADLRMEPGGLCETAGYEGEFASVRRPLTWTKGMWTYRVAKDREEVADGKTYSWFLCHVKGPNGTTTDVGRLRFEGSDFTYAPRHSAFVEVYATAPLPRSGIPKVNVTFGWPRLNGRKPEAKKVHAFYPDKKPTGSPDCAWVKASGENCTVELGSIFKRDEAQRRHALDAAARARLRVPAFTAYLDPDANGANVTKDDIAGWTNPSLTVSWFGEIKTAGKLDAAVSVRAAEGAEFKLTVGAQSREAVVSGNEAKFGSFDVEPGYVRFTLSASKPAGEIAALVLNGPAIEGAHFNLEPRRNAASVHLMYPLPKDAEVTAFYNEATGIDEPLWTYYMACGFARGYFGMQVNSLTERRIIFSVWDAGSGRNANTRTEVAAENHVQLLAKGDGVEASVFGGEGTGGHSHLVFPWKTGEAQRFVVTAKPDGTHTDYTGYWFHAEDKAWKLIASFRAPKDGKALRGLYSFSENFAGQNGHLRRKALFGPQWIRTGGGEWREITEASFSHDGTGKADRLDRFMGIERGLFFLSHGGFGPGFTQFGERLVRPVTSTPPDFKP